MSSSAAPTKPPTREQRKQCWKVRDEYFACLDKLNIIDPVVVEKSPEKAQACLEKKKKYEDDCMASWVEYFNKRRVLDVQQKRYLEFSQQQSGKK
ncbi:cytochrome oxidase c subunit VIb-domain-containing protein [Radiomyces spectabilis]|uniref:cytochrome oxidase c subunit VIb-domain-containing protein n=1 Tax=Radiomyces spectabilis TaxID=64574 RepID=UPI00221FF9A8|nr:cytochrome oxidase c subunit VIb-domain-containing protein [Radiomyces spectabilis]KAI8370496.1 cytochrome oxidase c subunit VIb-domain-containing protein [Radiomyces spectabilis]